jgi:hypothetical protein
MDADIKPKPQMTNVNRKYSVPSIKSLIPKAEGIKFLSNICKYPPEYTV